MTASTLRAALLCIVGAACDFFPNLPCYEDINCPEPKLCCDEVCVEPEVLEEIEDEYYAGELEEEGITYDDLEESGCLPRE